jgi:hypothetical protein
MEPSQSHVRILRNLRIRPCHVFRTMQKLSCFRELNLYILKTEYPPRCNLFQNVTKYTTTTVKRRQPPPPPPLPTHVTSTSAPTTAHYAAQCPAQLILRAAVTRHRRARQRPAIPLCHSPVEMRAMPLISSRTIVGRRQASRTAMLPHTCPDVSQQRTA